MAHDAVVPSAKALAAKASAATSSTPPPGSTPRDASGGAIRRAAVLAAIMLACAPAWPDRAAFTPTVFGAKAAHAADETFEQWRADFKARAAADGVSDATLTVLDDLTPNPRVVELDRRQPERRWTFAEYRERVLSDARIENGRRLLREHRDLLDQIGDRYGVPPRYIVALWGLETAYGAITGDFDVLRSLATLAWDGRRRQLFEGELLAALQILDRGEVEAGSMIGSWAGAMGQTQFMPTSFQRRAVDFDGDGKRDIWRSQGDVFASIANYLKNAGWNAEYRWGRPVEAPAALGEGGLSERRPLSYWAERGVRRVDGAPLPLAPIEASLIRMDDGASGSFLVYGNFHALMAWNRSTYFGMTVTELASRIR